MKLLVALLTFRAVYGFTDWQLLGHNNFRFRAKTTANTWKSPNMKAANYHYTFWNVPFGAGANLNGGAAQRTDDGHLFVQILGTVTENMNQYIGAEKKFGPPFVWELDGNTGKTVRMYNLSTCGEVFESPLRFTPAGNPMVALQSRKNGYRVLVLDRNSEDILMNWKPPIEPMLLFPTKTNPPSAVMSSMNEIATVEFDSTGKTLDPSTAMQTSACSTVIFGVDGLTMYNGAVDLESTGLYAYKLPITQGRKAKKLTSGISPYPWQTVNDRNGNVYGVQQYYNKAKSYDSSGNPRWDVNATGFWMAMSDDESMVLVGNSTAIQVLDASTGHNVYDPVVFATDMKHQTDTTFACKSSEQPWAPRHPLILADGRVAVLCKNQGGYLMSTFDLATGKVSMNRAAFTMNVIDVLTGDSANNIYAYGFENGVPAVQKINL